ncbi:Dcm Site-specific DNA methylase [uncultured Caudovirales phage]|uniref:Dcm Site-specific DNA methylase n=1 Tax=uncultured Caudovirales phage TaxID=2100421 RepID=A0A6J7X8E3_9CAUD|nr:Dcm Site-specific DNA methylase [uncultured Caudovirales phage]CAB4197629.1 Dcm Site-specific DNA methylase [uncultured Caudovirales phage]CAB4211409.1 Dcm Site-specific DNA methylase [uncultured Caudovirales phage]CAB5227154.1 Dcm Site-specific DNA methylase [uncultured Caudovirales phage]
MNVLSLFSGISAASVALKPLGWKVVAFSEIAPFPCSVLAHRYPNVPNLGDVTKITESQVKALGHIDIVVFGSPCQDLSVAGNRAGLAGARSGLFHDAVKILEWSDARFGLWENVPGAFSSSGGRDFSVALADLMGRREPSVPPGGWGREGAATGPKRMVEWATLDAQWFGVAQRRRRVLALADSGNWYGRSPVLLEPEVLRGSAAPSRESQKDNSGSTGDGVARCLTTGEAKRQDWETCNFVVDRGKARRLTPRECERLQGFPDDYTLVPHRGKPAADGPRYHALGNSMAVPVLNWVGRSLERALA